jgi:multiple sugar transport system ATP-binding protein
MTVAVSDLSKTYGDLVALQAVDLRADDQELLVVVGPSGSGKTTLLRCIAGLETPDSGQVEVGDRNVTDEAPGDRDVAMVFQEYALYPHLDAAANISFGLRARRLDKHVTREKVGRAARLLGIEDCLDRTPDALSGGERQRVALARAIVREPSAFLMDEPLANLDAELRARTRAELRSLQKNLATTMVYVTHDQTEAFTLGDRVAVLHDGRVAQVGTPRELYERPTNTFVARFFGNPPMNLLGSDLHRGPGRASVIGIRAERIQVVDAQGGRLRGTIKAIDRIGSQSIVHLDVSGNDVLATGERWAEHREGEEVGLDYSDSDVYPFGPDGGTLS